MADPNAAINWWNPIRYILPEFFPTKPHVHVSMDQKPNNREATGSEPQQGGVDADEVTEEVETLKNEMGGLETQIFELAAVRRVHRETVGNQSDVNADHDIKSEDHSGDESKRRLLEKTEEAARNKIVEERAGEMERWMNRFKEEKARVKAEEEREEKERKKREEADRLKKEKAEKEEIEKAEKAEEMRRQAEKERQGQRTDRKTESRSPPPVQPPAQPQPPAQQQPPAQPQTSAQPSARRVEQTPAQPSARRVEQTSAQPSAQPSAKGVAENGGESAANKAALHSAQQPPAESEQPASAKGVAEDGGESAANEAESHSALQQERERQEREKALQQERKGTASTMFQSAFRLISSAFSRK